MIYLIVLNIQAADYDCQPIIDIQTNQLFNKSISINVFNASIFVSKYYIGDQNYIYRNKK